MRNRIVMGDSFIPGRYIKSKDFYEENFEDDEDEEDY